MSTAKTVRAKIISRAEAGETLDDQTAGLNEPAREEIERRAYELYLARGEVNGHDQDDWLRALRELRNAQS
ncbi:MAG: hypothetical protein QOE96_995 [Blastocatellia bacterium]|jgi:hypothetical protein|nr:hypothetical protein [Blastocatellia bacterium]